MRFKDKVCIVTGGASGIGRAICKQLAVEGGKVVVVDINESGGIETVKEILLMEGQAIFIKADIADSKQIKQAVIHTFDQWQQIDILINNAAMMTFKKVIELEEDEWDQVIAVNLRACFLFCKYTIPYMLRDMRHGVIVNVSSVHARQTTPDVSPYAASKGGMEAFTRALAQEYKQDIIRVNCVAPGGTDTPLLWNNPAIKAMDPEKVIAADPAQIASVVCFVASNEAQVIHGTTIAADMGLLTKL